MNTRQRGFTLIELLIVMAIAGILAAVALPGYNSYVRKGKRVEAKTALMAVLQAQEKYRANCPQYASALGAASECTDTSHVVAAGGSGTSLYTLAVTAADGTGFTATATAAAGSSQAKDSGCTTLTLQLAQGTVSTTPASCW